MKFIAIFIIFFLPCVGIGIVFSIYICLLWYVSIRSSAFGVGEIEKAKEKKGLTSMELEKMGSCVVEEDLKGNECAVCLDEMEMGQVVRWLPKCHHGFHLKCADAWLSQNPACPLCRANVEIPADQEPPVLPSVSSAEDQC